MDWLLHHVNLPSKDVPQTRVFLRDVVGLKEGRWIYPEQTGMLHHDERSIAYFGIENRGIHAVRPIATFARDNGFLHNPTIGGHFAIGVVDIEAVRERLEAADIPYSDAGIYAMAGVHQIYVYDPSHNVIEINQMKQPLPEAQLAQQDPAEDVALHHVSIPAHDVPRSAAFFRDIVGLSEGEVPTGTIDGSGETREMAVFGTDGRGLRIVRPSVTYAHAHGLLHNPTLEPYFAITVSDIEAVKRRLDASGTVYSQADGLNAPDMPELLVYCPSMRLISINEVAA